MFTKMYSCPDFPYAVMEVPELQGREGLVSRRGRSLAALCYINNVLVLKADLEAFEMCLFRPGTHLGLPVMDSQGYCVFAQFTGFTYVT